jgi:hypothetical protein
VKRWSLECRAPAFFIEVQQLQKITFLDSLFTVGGGAIVFQLEREKRLHRGISL